jgi:hypothetical protein
MLKILSITLLISLSIFIAVIVNAWLLLPVIVSLYFLTKKSLSSAKTSTTHSVLRFGLVTVAALFTIKAISIIILILILLAYMLGFDFDKKHKDSNDSINRITRNLLTGVDEFSRNTTKITNTIFPKIDVKVRFSDGSIHPAQLTHSAVDATIVKSGDILFLTCGVNTKLDLTGYGYASCNLLLPKVAPKYTYFPEGLDAQFDWVFGANFQGITDPQTLILSQPLVWPPNNATLADKHK